MTTDELLHIFSPSTLASLIRDIDESGITQDMPEYTVLRHNCRSALIANVGEAEAAMLLSDGEPDDDDFPIKCRLCGAETTINNAPDEGWFPHYEVGEIEVDDFVCPHCIKTRLRSVPGGFALNGTADYLSTLDM